MQSLGWYVRRLRSMDASEIAWRIGSVIRDNIDAIRIVSGALPKVRIGPESDRANFLPGFSCSDISIENWNDLESSVRESWAQQLIEHAEKICRNRLSFFDLEDVELGDPIDWQRDYSAGISAPKSLSLFIDYRDFKSVGDCKLVWEPNRHHQLVVLGRAYRISGNERYAEKIAAILRSWIDANPFGYGMNWKSPLEVGVRIINWIWAIDLVRESRAIDERLWSDIRQNVFLALWDCDRKFSRGSSANNHLIGEAAGVFLGATYFSDFPKSPMWAARAKSILEEQVLRQTYSDGCTKEHAFGYMFFVTQFLVFSIIAAERAGSPFSAQCRRRVHEMYRFLAEVSRDTGQPPNVGDSDDGYVLDLGDRPKSARELITVGAHLFDDRTLALAEVSQSAFWLFGSARLSASTERLRTGSVPFKESGYFLLRSSRVAVFFDAASLGLGAIAAHGHADCLSFTMALDGRPVFVDPGTYDYFTYGKWRQFFRETRAHNTVEVDGQSQSQILGPFLWGDKATPRGHDWRDGDDVVSIGAGHDGYERLPNAVSHTRTMTLNKTTHALEITDQLSCSGAHKVSAYFHLAPHCHVEEHANNKVIIGAGGRRLALVSDKSELSVVRASESSELGWISSGYHERQASTCVRISLDIIGATTCRFVISPE